MQDHFTPADLLNIQLDTSAEFLSRWRTLLLQSLKTVTDQPRIRLREIVEGDWTDAPRRGRRAIG